MKRPFSIILLALVIGCAPPDKRLSNGFLIQGKTRSVNDGVMIQLFDDISLKVVDSTKVKDNEFTFEGVVADPPIAVAIKIKDSPLDYKYVWIENKVMNFDASSSNFAEAKFVGSDSHDFVQDRLYTRFDTIQSATMEDAIAYREASLKFVEEHPGSVISAHILSIYSLAPEVPLKQTKYLYGSFHSDIKETVYGKRVLETILKIESIEKTKLKPQVGDKFVDFEMMDMSGESIKLANHLGNVTLLEFWASACAPCREDNPKLVRTYKRFKDSGFEIFAVSLDTKKSSWLNAIREDGLPWIQVSDLEGNSSIAALTYGVGAIPDNFLIDRDGLIIGRNLRGESLDLELEKLLK